MTWQNVSKPNSSNYTKVGKNPINYPQYGSAIYGQSKYGITDANVKIAKPSLRNWVNIPKPV
jgi:hypothetical protein